METQFGFVGFFDIMGYKNIIRNNQIQDVAIIISEIIDKLPDLAKNRFAKYLFEDDPARRKIIETKSLIISDSILLFMRLPVNSNLFTRLFLLLAFIGQGSFLLRSSFDKGLPLRAAISSGEYFIHGNCFAGKSIIDSYELAHDLEFSGCVLTKNLENEYKKMLDDIRDHKDIPEFVFEGFNGSISPYLAPLKEHNEKLLLIDWLSTFEEWGEYPGDMHDYVMQAFQSYKRDIPEDVIPKIENTETILKYLGSRNWKIQ
jgi:hypothetical protein